MSEPISVTILSKNSERKIADVLSALSGFDEVILYDTGSSDRTLEIAKTFPFLTIKEGPFIGFGKTHNVVSNLAKNSWIFSIDSDEVVSSALKEEILSLKLDPREVYAANRINFYRGKEIRGCGWGNEWQKKLYHREKTAFSEASVHEEILSQESSLKRLKNPIFHYPFEEIADLLRKMNHYSSLFAEERRGQKASLLKAISRGFFAFFKSYFLRLGFLDGYRGFVISLYNGQTTLWKYLKLYELSN